MQKSTKLSRKLLKALPFCIISLQVWASEPATRLCDITDPKITALSNSEIAEQLGWVSADNRCGGYYLEAPFVESGNLLDTDKTKITGDEALFSLHSTSTYQGKVTITRDNQEVITNKAYLYRDPVTEKHNGIDLIGNVKMREPNSLIVARCGHIDLENKQKILRDILYRMAIYNNKTYKPAPPPKKELLKERPVTQLSAWGKANTFFQNEEKVYQFEKVSYSTCPPVDPAWQVDADHITLDKNSGRGIAKHAHFRVKGVPIFYAPYLNFPIDSRRQTGFLWPSVGSTSTSGMTFAAPFYWNLAPNYDDTLTPVVLAKRGLQINNYFRYLDGPNPYSLGDIKFTILPEDRLFKIFKETQQNEFQNSLSPAVQSQLHTLESANTTRGALEWRHSSTYDDHWSTEVNYTMVSDDYYLQDFSRGLNAVTPNQLLQQADLRYKSQYWGFTGRLQGYQTLHPINENTFYNQYIRLPQLVLDGNYPDSRTGLTYFISNEWTHFNIADNPGNVNPNLIEKQPIGNRYNIQPGISLPLYYPGYYIHPRLQVAMTQYELGNIVESNPKSISRVIPIVDINSGLNFDRNISLGHLHLRQTLEPNIYYTYIPYHSQNDIPIFDTTLNTLTYDQLFIYNRFSGLDRIGDTNQVSLGLTTRFIDPTWGTEKMSAKIGQIVYFQNRRVTMCSVPGTCDAVINSPENTNKRSPLSAVLIYNLTPKWSATSYTIWDSLEKQLTNQTLTVQYTKDIQRIINLTYTYVRNGDQPQYPPSQINKSSTNLSQTDISFAWPVTRDWSAVGRWTENWNSLRFQNFLYGLQYDTCCWALRVVAGKTFNSLTPNYTYQYNTEIFVEFALKGLGNFGTGNPGKVLNNATIANQTNFGQDF